MALTTDTFAGPDNLAHNNNPDALYRRSYLLIRTVVGIVGVALPTALFALDWLILNGDARVRGSLSAYYHSSARDLFVGGLCVIGVLLMTYMAAQRQTWDFWLSSIAGLAVLGVGFFPTGRPDLAKNAPLCGSDPMPIGCTPLQQALGEDCVKTFHFICAAVFILSLSAICFVFAHREKTHRPGHTKRIRLYIGCGGAILAAVGWILLGFVVEIDLFGFSNLYLGEVVSVYAFATCWFVTGHDLWKNLPVVKEIPMLR